MRRLTCLVLAGALTLAAGTATAGEADVVGVEISRSGDAYCFDVTVRHADAGWEHYADRWEVLTMDRKLIATRVLAHPHDDEQPFTRSLGGIRPPAGATSVRVRAHDKVHGYGGQELVVDLQTGAATPAGGQS